MDDTFQNLNNWNHEVQMNGFGYVLSPFTQLPPNTFRNGAFDWTTDDEANSYVDAQGLHIVPTMTLESTDITRDQLLNGFTVNMTTNSKTWGKCTAKDIKKSNDRWPCAARSNATLGQIINPVRSARLNTKGKKTIKYGRVEVTARMPKGDWMWPAIWMMPQDDVYGEWPKSGEIDIAESRGNDARKYPMGNNLVSSALHWGTATENDRWRRAYGEWGGKRVIYSEDFHVYGLEWSEKYLFTWLDGRLRVSHLTTPCELMILTLHSKCNSLTSPRTRISGPTVNSRASPSTAPSPLTHGAAPVVKTLLSTSPSISSSTSQSAVPTAGSRKSLHFPYNPNTKAHFLISLTISRLRAGKLSRLTHFCYRDAIGDKPWADSSETPMRDFWKANDTWLPTWGPVKDRGMIVKSVRMWQEGAC